MGGGKGGSSDSKVKVELPKYVEDAAKSNLDIADEVAAIGYTPYQGPTVAGFTPQQRAAMNNTMNGAGAFGMTMGRNLAGPNNNGGRGVDPLTGLAGGTQQNFAGGIRGYSPNATYEQAKNRIPAAQKAFIDSFTIDPNTGAQPANPAVPETQFRPNIGMGGKGGGTSGGGGGGVFRPPQAAPPNTGLSAGGGILDRATQEAALAERNGTAAAARAQTEKTEIKQRLGLQSDREYEWYKAGGMHYVNRMRKIAADR